MDPQYRPSSEFQALRESYQARKLERLRFEAQRLSDRDVWLLVLQELAKARERAERGV